MALDGLIEVGLAIVLVFLAPGYLSLLTLNRLRGAKGVENDLNNAILSIILSSLIVALWFVTNRLDDWESALAFASAHWIMTMVEVLATSLLLAAVTAIVFVRLFDPGVRKAHAVLYKGLSVTTHEDDVWDLFMATYHKKPVSVETSDGKVFQGHLQSFSTLHEEPAITISPVEEVTYDRATGEATATPLGEAMLFRNGDIRRVWGMTPPTTPDTPTTKVP